ncbi:MAG: DNA ligase D [Desulfuromonadales bacterium]
MGLEKYQQKRDFAKTPEPRGAKKGASGRLYIIQKHAARALHYDLRLEMGGVLKSWAVPKGPCLDPGQKRLAVHVEDHPLEYGSFEGTIPQGEYGGGAVLLWDRGEWAPQEDAEKSYRRGRLSFRLHGDKLRGDWTLVRMGGKGEGSAGENWLLRKRADAEARPGDDGEFLEENPRSVVSGRSMEEVAAAGGPVWRSNRATAEKNPVPIDPAALPGAVPARQPTTLAPQLTRLVTTVPLGETWLHELKFDGYRLICTLREGAVRLWTRSGQDWTERFPAIADAAAKLPIRQGILDGEVVVLDAQGISDFQALQNVLREGRGGRLFYYLFDLIHCNGYDLSRARLIDRKELLRQILGEPGLDGEPLRFSDHVRGQGQRVFQHACRFALEGIVSKRADSPYVARRASSWVKVKCIKRQEFVIGGFTPPGGSRAGFGALLLGYNDEQGDLIYCGKVGTGFSDQTLQILEKDLRDRHRETPLFRNPPRGAEARGVVWVHPELVAEIEFIEWTQDGRLRHPSFKGLREDRAAAGVVRENPDPPPSGQGKGRQAAAAREEQGVVVAGVTLSNPERIVYPEQGVNKAALARYYELIGERILPFLAGRPLTVVRCPQGRQKKCFYQKHLNESVPPPVRGVPVKEKEGEGLYLVVDDLAGVITLVQLGVLEFHPWGSREDLLERPDQVIFDLDPAPDVGWEDVIHAARLVRSTLEELGLVSFVKTSGGKGLHVVAPLTRRADWEEVRAFSRAVAEEIARREPGRYVTTMSKALRKGKIFIDFFRNSRGATSIAPYSTRARPGAPISAPLHWDELSPDLGPAEFTLGNLPARLARLRHEPWSDFFSIRQSIGKRIRTRLNY